MSSFQRPRLLKMSSSMSCQGFAYGRGIWSHSLFAFFSCSFFVMCNQSFACLFVHPMFQIDDSLRQFIDHAFLKSPNSLETVFDIVKRSHVKRPTGDDSLAHCALTRFKTSASYSTRSTSSWSQQALELTPKFTCQKVSRCTLTMVLFCLRFNQFSQQRGLKGILSYGLCDV